MELPGRIPLRRRDGSVRAWALVDAADYERFGHLRWCDDGDGYAMRRQWLPDEKRTVKILLHRAILGLKPGDPQEGDHENRNRLDNRRTNLRVVAKAAQRQNVTSARGSSSRYVGVTWYKRSGRWVAKVKVDGRWRHLGYFTDEDEAGRVAAAARRAHYPYSTDEPGEYRAPRTRASRSSGNRGSAAQALAIRLAAATTSLNQRRIADMVGVSYQMVSRILRGEAWLPPDGNLGADLLLRL